MKGYLIKFEEIIFSFSDRKEFTILKLIIVGDTYLLIYFQDKSWLEKDNWLKILDFYPL